KKRELSYFSFPVFFTSPFLFFVHLCLKTINYIGATRQTIMGIKKDSTKECCKTEGQENERNKYDNELERRESYPLVKQDSEAREFLVDGQSAKASPFP